MQSQGTQRHAMKRWASSNAHLYHYWALSLNICGYGRMIRRALNWIPANGPVLDVGCGDGEAIKYLSGTHAHAGFPIASDLSLAFLRPLRSRYPSLIIFAADAEHLPLRAESCGGALSLGVLGHLTTPTHAIHEISRVLLDRGRAVVWTRTDSLVSRLIVRIFELLNPGNRFLLHPVTAIRQILRESSLAVIAEEQVAGGRLWIVEKHTSSGTSN
jgi:ubiquinone/menaquinone biosynthesis C-methylase UbiE